MTELQLQAIVNQQGIEGSGESNLDMTVVNGVSVSKWHLDSMTYGKEVPDTFKESVKKYLQQFVGSERVFLNKCRVYRVRTNSGTVRYNHWGPRPHTRMKKLNPIDLV